MPDAMLAGIALMMALMSGEERAAASCHVPQNLSMPRAEGPESPRDVRRIPVDGYTLALSWTPQYCAGQGGTQRRDAQCDTRNGRFGFVLHGLWPEGRGRAWPQYCAPVPIIPREVLRENFCATPSVQLMQHEWAKHGSCMARTPKAYFDRARTLYQSLRMPDMRALAAERRLTAGQLAGAIARVNPGMRTEMLRIQSSRSGMVSEVWLCLDTGFKPVRCPAGKAGLGENARIGIRTSY